MLNWFHLDLFLLFSVPIALVDMRDYRIPDLLTFGGTAVFFVLDLLLGRQTAPTMAFHWLVGFGVFWLLWKLTGGGIGLGDAKFSAFIAVALGLPAWFMALLAASIIGLLAAGVLVGAFKMDRRAAIPFAPFLTVGAAIALMLAIVGGGKG
jgi:leader peptidase (prepilin peptidase)/N-methyltransferase